MKPIRTPDTNITYTAAGGDEDRVLPMPATLREADEVPGIYSTWELTADERARIMEGGHIEVGVAATKPPPMGLAVVPPFCSQCGGQMEWSDELKTFTCPANEE